MHEEYSGVINKVVRLKVPPPLQTQVNHLLIDTADWHNIDLIEIHITQIDSSPTSTNHIIILTLHGRFGLGNGGVITLSIIVVIISTLIDVLIVCRVVVFVVVVIVE